MPLEPARTSRRRLCAVATLVAALVAASAASAQSAFPDRYWPKPDAVRAGWSVERLAAAEERMASLGSTSVMIVQRGGVIAAWGDVARKVRVASVRKSLLSALIGLAVAEGRLDLDATLADLGIDDNSPSLSSLEKSARVRDLIRARSGVYHEAAAETVRIEEKRPPRGSHPPGTFWFYNNWDFNALGTIYRHTTGEDIFAGLEKRIARPIGMQDFTVADGHYVPSRKSVHPAYHMDLSARDLARFGLLFLQEGNWKGRVVVPASWVAESTRAHSDADRGIGYGYMWWSSTTGRQFRVAFGPGSYSARGFGGQLVLVAPAHELVVVHLTERYLTDRQYGELLALIMAAAPSPPAKAR